MILAALALLTATPATMAAQLALAQPGDVIQLAPGWAGPLGIKNLHKVAPGVTIDGGGQTLAPSGIFTASGFTVQNAVFSGCPNACFLVQYGSSQVTLRDNVFFGVIGISGATHVVVKGNAFRSVNDGIDITGSQFVDVENNNCLVKSPSVGHADCVQFWQDPGQAEDADITIAYNDAIGWTQGFDNAGSRAPGPFGTIRLNMHDNGYAGMGTAGGVGDCLNCAMTNNWAVNMNVTPKGVNIIWGMSAPAGALPADQPIIAGNVNGVKN